MNRNLWIALALSSIVFYQSNASILFSSEILINQVKEEQEILTFNLALAGQTLIISADHLKESSSYKYKKTKINTQTKKLKEKKNERFLSQIKWLKKIQKRKVISKF